MHKDDKKNPHRSGVAKQNTRELYFIKVFIRYIKIIHNVVFNFE